MACGTYSGSDESECLKPDWVESGGMMNAFGVLLVEELSDDDLREERAPVHPTLRRPILL